MATSVAALGAVLVASGCFEAVPPVPPAGMDTDDTDPTTTASTSGEGGEGSSDGGGTTDADTGSTQTTDPADASSTAGAESTGPAQLGPQVVFSEPADGATQAAISGSFVLMFDRPVSALDAAGRIFVAQGEGDPVPASGFPCPNGDPTCLFGQFPEDPFGRPLSSDTAFSVIVAADFPDAEGNTNTEDQRVEFQTFAYEVDFYDDGMGVSDELGGLAYDPANDALFFAGTNSNTDCLVRRIGFSGGDASPATTVASPVASQGLCYGLERYGDALYVAMTYDGNVRRYAGLDAATLDATEERFEDPTLEAPFDTLLQVTGTAEVGNRRFFGFGSFFGGAQSYAVLEYTAQTWSVFQEGTNLWQQDAALSLTGGSVDGTGYLFVRAPEHLLKFRVSDGSLVGELEVEQGWDFDLELDAFGRLYVASGGRLTVYDAGDLSVLAEAHGLETGRIAVDASEDAATVYFAAFREPAIIGRLQLEF